MQTVSYTDARNQLARLMDTTVRDREPITITRNGEGKVVMISADEFAAMEETLHLLSTPANAERIPIFNAVAFGIALLLLLGNMWIMTKRRPYSRG